jgi:hypothetical protein
VAVTLPVRVTVHFNEPAKCRPGEIMPCLMQPERCASVDIKDGTITGAMERRG